MRNRTLLVKIFDSNKSKIGSGILLSINKTIIIIKGDNLPVLDAGTEVTVQIYDELVGVTPYLCRVSVASKNQMTAEILKKESAVERRNSLKVQTDLSFYVNKLMRSGDDVTDEFPPIKVNIVNLSIGGMLISSNFNFELCDEFTFLFENYKYSPFLLKASVIRIDKPDKEKKISYGCRFVDLSDYDEAAICRYLFEHQLLMYRTK
jgi:c-di-GMP-binding flagellar brake protein YcgR